MPFVHFIFTGPCRPGPLIVLLTGVLLAAFTGATRAQDFGTYERGYRHVARLETDLFTALEPKRRKHVSFETVLLEGVRLPCLASVPGADGGPGGALQVSAGCIDFLNRLAHAKAHEEMEPGFFRSYTGRLGEDSRLAPVPAFEVPLPKKAWNFQTLNRQASYFNQMAGGLLAVDLAHHYLGHYRDHAGAFTPRAALPRPINTLITEAEWREAVLNGSRNALACGLATDGLRAVFECFEPMSPRPAWAAYFIHPQADVRRIGADLVKEEREFFAMDREPRRLTGKEGDKGR